jgi:hypothetical protein
VIDRRLALIVLLCIACKPDPKPAGPAAAAAAGPQTKATVVTIRTTIEPSKQTTTHTLVIAGDVARSTDELDAWRLFDVKKGTVTFVDDVAKTVRTVPYKPTLPSQALPTWLPRVTWQATGEKRAIAGVNAEQSLMRVGTYRRELWIGKHRAIPDQLFAMIQLSDPPKHELTPMMHAAQQAIAATRGFPMLDRTEVPYGKASRFVIERAVVGVEEKQVPKAMLEVPKDYKTAENGVRPKV